MKSVLLTCIGFIFLGAGGVNCTSFGCFREDQHRRHFAVSAGNYDPDELTPDKCKSACSSLRYGYAGTTAGKYCFCSNESPPPQKRSNACNKPCSGDHEAMCGDDGHVTVYKTTPPVKGISLNVSHQIVEVLKPVTISVIIPGNTENLRYAVDFDDGVGQLEASHSNKFTKTYGMPGEVRPTVHVQNSDSSDKLGQARKPVFVQAPVEDLKIECRSPAPTHEEIMCQATIVSGSRMKISLDFGVPESQQNFTIADARWYSAGIPIPNDGKNVLADDTRALDANTYVIPDAVFRQPGRLMTWELYARAGGNIELLILRPKCGAQEKYCFYDGKCKVGDCTYNLETTKCKENERFCGRTGVCYVPGKKETCKRKPSPPDRFSKYHIKKTMSYEVKSAGHHVLQAKEKVNVEPGDVIGFTQNKGIIGGREWRDDELKDSVGTSRSGTDLTVTDKSSQKHYLRAVAAKPSLVRFYHTYTETGKFTVTANVKNQYIKREINNTFKIDVQKGIKHVIIVAKEYVATNDTIRFSLLPLDAGETQHSWKLGDGSPDQHKSSIDHLYKRAGFYDVTVTVNNSLTQKSNKTTVTVQDRVTGLIVNASEYAVSGNISFFLRLSSGSGYLCTWDFDDLSYTTNATETPPSGKLVTFLIEESNVYYVNVTCANQVSSKSQGFTQIVQDPASGLDLKKYGAEVNENFTIDFYLTSGTNITVSVNFSGEPRKVTFNESQLTGSTDVISGRSLGPYNVVLHAENLVSSATTYVNFSIEYEIQEPGCNSTKPDIKLGEHVEFWVWMTGGSGVQVVWKFEESVEPENFSYPQEQWQGGVESRKHRFREPGIHNVKINIYNTLDSYICSENVTVITAVENVTLKTSAPVPYDKAGSWVNFTFFFAGYPPTDAFVIFDYGDGTGEETANYTIGDVYSHSYKTMGTFKVKCTMSNQINSVLLEETVHVVVAVTNMKLHVTPSHAIVNQSVQVGVSMDQGIGVTLHWFPGDTDMHVESERNGTKPMDMDTFLYAYRSEGQYEMSVIAVNALGNTTVNYSVLVQYPVKESDFTITSNAPLMMPADQLWITVTFNGKQPPTRPMVSITGADEASPSGYRQESSDGKHWVFSLDLSETKGGSYKASVTVHNEASSFTYIADSGVYHPITTMTMKIRYRPLIPLDGDPKSGFGRNKNEFPYTRDLLIYPEVEGTVQAYDVEARGTSAVQFCEFNDTVPLVLRLPASGTYHIKVKARNPGSSKTVEETITLLEGITGISIQDGYHVTLPGQEKAFTITFASLGVEACLLLQWGDGSSGTYYGNKSRCAKPYMKYGAPLRRTMTVSHVYHRQGRYVLNAYGWSPIGNTTNAFLFSVSGSACSSPIIDIKDAAMYFYKPKEVYRKDNFVVTGLTNLKCFTTLINEKLWKVYRADRITGRRIEEIPLDAVASRYNAELAINKRFLNVGLYKFVYTVQMSRRHFTNRDIFAAEAFTYVAVKSSPLVPVIVEGGISRVTVGHGRKILLQPGLYSLDPDVDRLQPQQIQRFQWFCRRIDEILPKDNKGAYALSNPSRPLTKSQIEKLKEDRGGCFRQGPGPLEVPGNGGNLTFNTINMLPNERYEFLVEAQKDGRSAISTLQMDIVKGDPSHVSIRCALGGICRQRKDGQGINPSNRLAVMAVCLSGCSDDIQYTWSLAFRGFTEDHWIEIQNIEDYVEGVRSSQITFAKSVFTSHDWYRIRLTATRHNFPAAFAYMKLAINQPPEGGSCTVNNTVGVAFTDVWHLRCTGWFDMDGITMYQFYAVFRDEPMERHLSYDVKDEIMTVLPAGPEYDNYTMTLKVRITDEMKAVTEVTIGTVQVIPPSANDLDADFTRLLATDQSQKVKAQGDILEMNQEYLKLASALNMARETNRQGNPEAYTVASTRTSGYGPRYKFISQAVNASNLTAEEQERVVQAARDRRAMMREAMSEALTNVTKSTVESIQLSVSTISVLTEAPEELTRKSQDCLSKSLKNMSQTLYDLSDDTPREEVIRTSTNLIAASGGVFEASMVTLNHGTNIDIKRATQGAHYEYDTSLEAETMRLDGYGKATATEMFQKEANKLEQEDAAPEIVSNLMDTLNRTTGAIMKNSIPGEEKVKLVTPRLSYSLQMDTAQKVLNKTVEEGDAKAEFPDICQLVNRTNCSSDQVVTLRTMATPTNMYRYVPNGENAPEISGTLSLDMYDEMHEEMYIEEAPSPLTVHIPRDPNIDILDATNVTAFMIHKKNVNLFFRSFFIQSHSASVHIEVTPDDPTARLLVLGRFGGKFPRFNGTDRAWDFMRVVPDDTPPTENICGTPKRNEIFLDNNFVNNRTGKVVLGFRRITPEEYKEYERGKVPEVTDPASGLVNTTFQLRTYTSGCYYYDTDRLSASGCRVCADTTHTMTVCQCNHMTTFAGGWAVQPNSLDWDFVFSHMDFSKNPTLYVTMINITILYVGFAVWARYQDKKDLEKLGVTPLEDNDPDDKYLYEVIFVTGGRKNAGTDSQVQFILSGELDETDVRMVSDKKRKILRRGSTNSFLMATPRPLGSLNYCRVWHDNSGQGKFASWYLNHIIVHDLQTRDRHYFICNRWFAVEEGDGQVDRTIPVAGPEQMSAFAHLFGQQTRKNLGDEHLWFSVIARPPTSRFTRLQRVSCCLCLLYTSMLANAVFYDRVPDAAAPGQQAYTLGPFALSMEQIYVGIISNLMVFPINFLIVLLFRKARPRHKRPSRIQEALRKQGAGPGSTLAEIKLDLGVLDKTGLVTTDTPYKTDAKPITAMPRPSVSSVSIEATDGIKKKKKRKFAMSSLPWWLSIVSWVVLWLVVLISASFVLFYGIHFGNDKCRKWISSMIMSFITSIFLTQPLKVILLALLFSLIFKKPRMEDDLDLKDEEDHELSSDEEFLHWEPHRGFAAATRARKVAYRPPDPEELERAREQRLKELKMYDILREVLFYSMFLWILLVISYSYRDPNAYLLKKGMEDLFINNDAPHVDGFDNDFTKVDTIEKFWNWTESVLVPGLRAGKWYNGDPPLEQRGFVGDRVGRIMGYATMRQLRVKKGLCEVPEEMIKYVKGCNLPYNFWDEEENHHGIGWAPPGKRNVTAYEYIYRTGKELDSYPYWGLHGMYSGGGYVAELRASRARMAAKVRQLRLQRWIDKYTRVIFIEFTIYNPNVNLFGISTLVAEVLNSGGIFTSYRFEPVNLLSYFTGTMLFQIVCEIIYMFFILFFVIKEVRSMKKQGKEYFKQFWNWVELCIIGFSVSGTIIYFYRLILTRELVTRFKESHGNEYMKFQYVGRWNELLMCMVAWLVFLASLKFLKLLRFNKKIGMMAATLRYGSVHMLAFGFMFSIMFSAFAQFFYLIYHIEMQSFSTIVRSAETCMQMMLGRFNFYAMKTAQPLLGPLFFFVYTVVVAYILINMFLTILNESFSIVRADLAKQSNEYEMVEFILRRFKIWTGLGYHSNDKGFPDVGKHGIQPIFPYELDEFPHKVDRLLNCISKAYFDQDRFESIFDTSSPGHKEMMKKLMMNQKKPLGEQRKADILRVDIGRSFGDADC